MEYGAPITHCCSRNRVIAREKRLSSSVLIATSFFDPALAIWERTDSNRPTQYYGWALHNRAALLPTWGQLQRAESIVRAARAHLVGQMQIIYVIPDYYSRYPKLCMRGWGCQQLTVAPNGDVLPCPAAGQITALPVENVRQHSLAWIWDNSPMFNRFRGIDWMPEPCRNCPR
jgi:PqqA peptide cyclase